MRTGVPALSLSKFTNEGIILALRLNSKSQIIDRLRYATMIPQRDTPCNKITI